MNRYHSFHAKAYAAGNVVIALVGDLSRTEAEAIAAHRALRAALAVAVGVGREFIKADLDQRRRPAGEGSGMAWAAAEGGGKREGRAVEGGGRADGTGIPRRSGEAAVGS